ncbi:MAG: enoyl-CoA hydratase/isomerase family protein [Pirellulales bacterium]
MRRKIAAAAGIVRPAPYEEYQCLKFRCERGVLFVTIDHPPMNLMDQGLLAELSRLATEIAQDDAVSVAIFESADPDFFISHADVHDIEFMPTTVPPRSKSHQGTYAIYDQYCKLPKVTIARIEGVARGAGSEFALSLDLRYGAIGKAVLAQPELGVGLTPGGGASQRLPRLIGRARTLEVLLSCSDYPAEIAEQYGYINRAVAPEHIGPMIDDLAYRIASYPAEAIARVKRAVQASELPLDQGLLEEAHLFNQAAASAVARRRMAKYFELGGQTRKVDLDSMFMADILAEIK